MKQEKLAQKLTIYQNTFFISGSMCLPFCGNRIKSTTESIVEELKQAESLPQDAILSLYNPSFSEGFGIVKIEIAITADKGISQSAYSKIEDAWLNKLKEKFPEGDKLKLADDPNDPLVTHGNLSIPWYKNKYYTNIFLNILAGTSIVLLFLFLPNPLLFLILATTLAVPVTLFSAREYLKNWKAGDMYTLISSGIALCYGHILYHFLTASLMLPMSFPMAFMIFLMPIVIVLCLNIIDLIKNFIEVKSKKLFSQRSILNKASDAYDCYAIEDDKSEENILQTLQTTKPILKAKGSLKKGDYLRIKNGEYFPTDGVIVSTGISGQALIDTKILNGEIDQIKLTGDEVPALAQNIGKVPIFVKATSNWCDSTAFSLLFIANKRINTDPDPKVSFAIFFANKHKYLIGIVVLVLCILVISLPFAFGVMLPIGMIIKNLMSVAFAICPCSLAIASSYPSVVAALRMNAYIFLTNKMTRKEFSERAKKCTTFIFDKTGTLTTGNSCVDQIDDQLKSILPEIVALEEHCGGNSHPIGRTIIAYAKNTLTKKETHFEITSLTTNDSRGISGIVNHDKITIGNEEFLQANNIPIDGDYKIKANAYENKGLTCVFVAKNKSLQGIISIKHVLRDNIFYTLNTLKSQGKTLILLTGDTKKSTENFIKNIGLAEFLFDEVQTDKSHQDKTKYIKECIEQKRTICYIADGINDATAMRQVSANGGISLAVGMQDMAVRFSDAVLTDEDLLKLIKLQDLTHINKTQEKINYQNIGIITLFALFMIAFMLFFSISMVGITPLLMVFMMLCSTSLILLNTHRLYPIVDKVFLKKNYLTNVLASDWYYGMILGGCALTLASLFGQAVATGGLPVIMFTSGLAIASSVSLFTGLGTVALCLLLFALFIYSSKPKLDNLQKKPPVLNRYCIFNKESSPIGNNENSFSHRSFYFGKKT